MEIVTLILLAVVLLKIVSIVQAIRWLGCSGHEYAKLRSHSPPGSEEDYFVAFERSSGKHFPFGVKDYLLRRYISDGSKSTGIRHAAACVASIFQKSLYRFERLTLIVGFWAVVMVTVQYNTYWLKSIVSHNALLYILTSAVLATNILLSVEAVFSYAILGGYATPFHMLGSPRSTRLLLELGVVIGKIVTTIFSGAVTAYVVYLAFDGLQGATLDVPPPANAMKAIVLFLQMVYWVTTTFSTVGYGDITPSNGYGQLVAFLIEVQAFAVLGIVFASLFTAKDAGSVSTEKNRN